MIRTENTTVSPPPVDNAEARWRHLTEALIFAAPYSASECIRILDDQRRPYNREQATAKCIALGKAILSDYPCEFKLLAGHAANDSPTFRLRYGHLLPKRPIPIERSRRPGPTPEQRESDAEELVDAVMGGR